MKSSLKRINNLTNVYNCSKKAYKIRFIDWTKRRLLLKNNQYIFTALLFLSLLVLSLISIPTSHWSTFANIESSSPIIPYHHSYSHLYINKGSSNRNNIGNDVHKVSAFRHVSISPISYQSTLSKSKLHFLGNFIHKLSSMLILNDPNTDNTKKGHEQSNYNEFFEDLLPLNSIGGSKANRQLLHNNHIRSMASRFWLQLDDTVTNLAPSECRNTLQGPFFVTDEKGYLCPLAHLLANGCCDINRSYHDTVSSGNMDIKNSSSKQFKSWQQESENDTTSLDDIISGTKPQSIINLNNSDRLGANNENNQTRRYVCDSCETLSRCCSSYEHCVSCCLSPSNYLIIRAVMTRYGERDATLSAARDTYEACLAKCRTSGVSVTHENAYRDPAVKHCYGLSQPRIRADQAIVPNRV
ncbi:unnamed protein product [Gordionus sp. m RMFG-2023]|uniref:uncharacterized protein LOC135923510 n=1 Tax=Gordionus sp. m RMFG-2023 TaxID=3053472 RepID=UPI0030E213E2